MVSRRLFDASFNWINEESTRGNEWPNLYRLKLGHLRGEGAGECVCRQPSSPVCGVFEAGAVAANFVVSHYFFCLFLLASSPFRRPPPLARPLLAVAWAAASSQVTYSARVFAPRDKSGKNDGEREREGGRERKREVLKERGSGLLRGTEQEPEDETFPPPSLSPSFSPSPSLSPTRSPSLSLRVTIPALFRTKTKAPSYAAAATNAK